MSRFSDMQSKNPKPSPTIITSMWFGLLARGSTDRIRQIRFRIIAFFMRVLLSDMPYVNI